jgi:hypothetical protein
MIDLVCGDGADHMRRARLDAIDERQIVDPVLGTTKFGS